MPENKVSKDDLIVIRNEIVMAEKLIEDKIRPQMQNAIDRYTSRHVPSIAVDSWDIVLNEIYPIVQYELPSIFFRNPRVFLKPRSKNFIVNRRDPITGEKVPVFLESSKSAKTQEHILNYTLSQIRYKEEVRRVLLDALIFKFGILWHGYKGEFGMTEEQSIYIQEEKVFTKRISPANFIFDPKVTLSNIEDAQWMGRSFEILLKDLKEDDKLDVEKDLKGKPGFGMVLDSDLPTPMANGGWDTKVLSSRARTLFDYTDPDYRQSYGSRFVKCYEILKRPSKKEKREGKKGNILLLTPEQKKPLRDDAWPYKAEGWPGKILMFNEVPDSLYGLSDLEVYGSIADHKNLVINLQLRNAQANSKLMVIFDKSGMEEPTVQKIESGQQNIIGVDGDVRSKLSIASGGGQASSELYILDQRIQANLDEKSGITDLKKGFLRSGEESATSVQIRNAGASARPAYRQDIMSDFLKESVLYINQLLKQFMPIEEAVRITGSLDIEWSEKPTKEEIQADVDAEIDVISMLPENPEKEIQELTTVLNMMIEALNNPNVSAKLAEEGNKFNVSPIIENLLLRLKIRDPEVFRKVRPEESMGVASVAEMKMAQANVEAALSNQEPPFPPAEGQEHATRLGVYEGIQRILQMDGKISDILDQLIIIQKTLAEQEAEKEAPRASQQVTGLKKPSIQPIG